MLVASKALFDQSTGRMYGTLYVVIRDRNFKPFYANFTSEGNDVVLLNEEGVIVSSNRTELIGMGMRALQEVVTDQGEGEDDPSAYVMGNERIVFSEYLPEFEFYLVNMIDKKAVTDRW